jgi:hypothetical protein
LLDGRSNVEEQKLLENFDNVIEVFQSLKPAYRKVIQNNAREMAIGMSKYQQQGLCFVCVLFICFIFF